VAGSVAILWIPAFAGMTGAIIGNSSAIIASSRLCAVASNSLRQHALTPARSRDADGVDARALKFPRVAADDDSALSPEFRMTV